MGGEGVRRRMPALKFQTHNVTQNFMDNGAFKFSEAKLAKQLGLHRGELRYQREANLTEDLEWKNLAGEIALTGKALLKLCDALQVNASEMNLAECGIETAEEKKLAQRLPALICDREKTAGDPMPMTVRQIFPNPRLLEAVDARGARCQVLVGDNANFVRGMQFKAIPDPSTPGFYRLAGPLPRWKGRW